MSFKSVQIKIVSLVAGLLILGLGASVYFGYKLIEANLINEKLKASILIAEPVMTAVYEDMIEGRADLVRHMLDDTAKAQGRGSIFIVRSNGVEEAFRDMKTVNEVIKVYGKLRPEWVASHANDARNVASGTNTPEFKEAFERYRMDWGAGPVNYIEKSEGPPFFVYLQSIDTRLKCKACHTGDGARGVLVIRMPLESMYAALSRSMNQWVFASLIGVFVVCSLLLLMIKRLITGPLRRNIEGCKAFVEGRRGLSERLENDAASEGEIGEFGAAFNKMLDIVQRRERENSQQLDTVSRDSGILQAALDVLPDMISIHDIDKKALKVNKALANRLKTTQAALIGKRCHDIYYNCKAPHNGCPHEKAASTGKIVSNESSDMLISRQCSLLTIPVANESGKLMVIVHVVKDMTVEKLLCEQLIEKEKLSSVKKLVNGIAHELNNPLMAIIGFAQLVIDKPMDRPISEITDKLIMICNESQRAAKIVKNLLVFVSVKKGERNLHDINDIIRETVSQRAYEMKEKKITVSLDLEPTIPCTLMDHDQIQLALHNILNNAEDAIILKGERGRIDITTRHKRGNIEVFISDDGAGLKAEYLKNLFDPFFTTKDKGKGTGMSLSVTHDIITGHGGLVNISNRKEGGAAVEVSLPVISVEQWSEVKKAVDGAPAQLKNSRAVRALIIESDAEQCESLRDILITEGFSCETAYDPVTALAALKEGDVTLLFIDLDMAGREDKQLYSSILAQHEYLKDRIICVSQNPVSIEARLFLEITGCPHISTPVSPRVLASLIRVMLT